MTDHDTWGVVKSPSNFDQIPYLFPHGLPLRDPFPMAGSSKGDPLFIIDRERLNDHQYQTLKAFIRDQNDISDQYIDAMEEEFGGLCVHVDRIKSLNCGLEGFARCLELAEFLKENPKELPDAKERFLVFCEQQKVKWIEGDVVPPPLPDWDEIPEEIKTPELSTIYNQFRAAQLVNSRDYSLFDLLSGQVVVDVLNEIDPEPEYSIDREEE